MKDDKCKLTPVFKLYEIVQEGAPHLKTLHRNMLYPYRSVVIDDRVGVPSPGHFYKTVFNFLSLYFNEL